MQELSHGEGRECARMDGESTVKTSKSNNPFGINPVYWERIQKMRLLDDALMCAAMKDNIPAAQLILRTIMKKDDLVITGMTVQSEYKNLYGRSLILDVDAIDSSGKRYDIEVQRAESGAYPERGRYHMAVIDANSLEKDHPFSDLPTVYVIFITETDYFKQNRAVYHIDRTVEETGEKYGDRGHILYVNGEYKGDDPIGILMADFRERDPGKIRNKELADRVYDLKNREDEVRAMCRAMEITFEEGRMEGEQTTKVCDIENIMETMGLSLAEAFKALRIQADEHQKYTNLIAQRSLAAGKG